MRYKFDLENSLCIDISRKKSGDKMLAVYHAKNFSSSFRSISNVPMAKVQKIGRVTFRAPTNEEALAKYGSSFVFVGRPVTAQRAEEATKSEKWCR
jgi:hypothetical protein